MLNKLIARKNAKKWPELRIQPVVTQYSSSSKANCKVGTQIIRYLRNMSES